VHAAVAQQVHFSVAVVGSASIGSCYSGSPPLVLSKLVYAEELLDCTDAILCVQLVTALSCAIPLKLFLATLLVDLLLFSYTDTHILTI
jgi:hypothetical protein